MTTKIFLNLPVKDITRTNRFFTDLGFSFNPHFTNEKATCLIVSDDIFVMLMQEEYFKTFTSKDIADATKSTEMMLCLTAESRQYVKDMVNKAVNAGGSILRQPQEDSFMYGHGFQDLDGHIWELMWMDPDNIPK